MPRLRTQDAVVAPFPLPPLAEQHRIVAKVDELMALCDRLEETHKTREATRDRLTTASFARLTAPDTDQQAFQSHARFALDSLPVLTARPDQIKELRQSILNLAVLGKLSRQDHTDGSATELISKLIARRVDRVARGELKKSKTLTTPKEDELTYNLPQNWTVTRLGTVFDVRDGTHDTPKYVDEGYPLVTSKNLSTGSLCFDGCKLISYQDYCKIYERSAVDKGDILFAMIGSIGNPIIVDTDRPFSIKNVALIKPIDKDLSCLDFLRYFLEWASEEMKVNAKGGLQPFVSLQAIRGFPVALPPLSEQRRIANQIDELMVLCRQLEAGVTKVESTRSCLLESMLRQALAPVTQRPAPA